MRQPLFYFPKRGEPAPYEDRINQAFQSHAESRDKWMTPDQFNQWVEEYNTCDIEMPECSPGFQRDWQRCMSSDLYRATETAKAVYPGEIHATGQLREIDIRPVCKAPKRLPVNMWLMLGRIAWYRSHRSQEESRRDTELRAKLVIDQVETNPDANMLVVTHGAFMKVLRQELLHRGYHGDSFLAPKNGCLYTFEKVLHPGQNV